VHGKHVDLRAGTGPVLLWRCRFGGEGIGHGEVDFIPFYRYGQRFICSNKQKVMRSHLYVLNDHVLIRSWLITKCHVLADSQHGPSQEV
jgi:hypothetical protein